MSVKNDVRVERGEFAIGASSPTSLSEFPKYIWTKTVLKNQHNYAINIFSNCYKTHFLKTQTTKWVIHVIDGLKNAISHQRPYLCLYSDSKTKSLHRLLRI